jgi:hypothetical protein
MNTRVCNRSRPMEVLRALHPRRQRHTDDCDNGVWLSLEGASGYDLASGRVGMHEINKPVREGAE